MLTVMLIAILTVSTTIAIHYFVLRTSFWWLSQYAGQPRFHFGLIMTLVLTAHCLEVCVFGLGHYATVELAEVGIIKGEFDGDLREYIYFSFVSYTSLGLGDIYPHGPVRLLTGIEALTGLLMIGWSASFTYLCMNRAWERKS